MSNAAFGQRAATSAGASPAASTRRAACRASARAPRVAAEIGVDLQVGADRVPAARAARACRRRRAAPVLLGVGAEQAIPDDEHAAEVAVEVGVVDGVVDAVVARRAEPAVEPAEAADLLGVDPELVEQVDQRDDAEDQRRKAGERHRQVEDPAGEPAARGLAQRGREVVVLALVMDDVRGPEQRDAVAGAVVPVVEEVVADQRHDPDPRRRMPAGATARSAVEHAT